MLDGARVMSAREDFLELRVGVAVLSEQSQPVARIHCSTVRPPRPGAIARTNCAVLRTCPRGPGTRRGTRLVEGRGGERGHAGLKPGQLEWAHQSQATGRLQAPGMTNKDFGQRSSPLVQLPSPAPGAPSNRGGEPSPRSIITATRSPCWVRSGSRAMVLNPRSLADPLHRERGEAVGVRQSNRHLGDSIQGECRLGPSLGSPSLAPEELRAARLCSQR